jgi:hypothetical protein
MYVNLFLSKLKNRLYLPQICRNISEFKFVKNCDNLFITAVALMRVFVIGILMVSTLVEHE